MIEGRNIFLVGPMGSGKSAVGRRLASLLDRDFYDSDAEVERRTGVDIPYIFEREGEAGFRLRETETLDALTQLSGIVLATGGGAILSPENRRWLADRGCTIYLATSVAQQVRRVGGGRNRPLLKDADPRERLSELMRIRAPLYEEIAEFTVHTDQRRVQAVVDEILRHIGVSVRPRDGHV